jgi:hypothetical protein
VSDSFESWSPVRRFWRGRGGHHCDPRLVGAELLEAGAPLRVASERGGFCGD